MFKWLGKSLAKQLHFYKAQELPIEEKLWLSIMLKEEQYIWRLDNFSKLYMILEQQSDLMVNNHNTMPIELIV